MHLNLRHVPYPLPVIAYEPPSHPHGEAIRILRPTADPQSINLVPGMEADLSFDNGSIRHIRIGKRWTSDHAGAELRISIESVTISPEPLVS